MGAAEAYQAGGPALVLIVFAAAVITYLLRENSGLRKDKEDLQLQLDDISKESRGLLSKREERDQERLRRFEEQDRMQELKR